MLDSYKSGRIPHAWLIGGEPGIGKATLAYRMARFVLVHPDPGAADVQRATSLALADDDPVVRRVAAQAQGELLVLERVVNEKTGKLFTEIRGRGHPPHRRIFRLHRGRGRLARRHRRFRRRAQRRGPQCAAESSGRAAGSARCCCW